MLKHAAVREAYATFGLLQSEFRASKLRPRPATFAAAAWLALMGVHSASAQTLPQACQPTFAKAAQGLPFAYARRSEAYCDGAVPILNQGQVEVVSYTTAPVAFGRTQPSLEVRPAVPTDSPIRLVGLDERPGQSYRLDGLVPMAGLVIDLRAAIIPLNIPSSSIGLFGWSDAAGIRRLVPLSLAAGSASQATLTFRTPVALVQVTGELCEPGKQCLPPVVLGNNLLAGRTFEMTLRSTGKPRLVTLNILEIAPGNRMDTNAYTLWVP